MAISNFLLQPQSDNALRRELYIAAGASIDYETAADRVQRGWLVASRDENLVCHLQVHHPRFQVGCHECGRASPLEHTCAAAAITLNVPADLSAVSQVVDLSALTHDDEGDAIFYKLGTVPSGITAARGVGQNAHLLTVTYPAQFSNPPSNLSFMVPLSLEQPLGTKLVGSDRNLPVRVLRYSPQPIHTSYSSPLNQGRLYIDRTANHFEVTLNNWIQNHSNRPLRVGYGTGYSHSWSDRIATYTIGETNGIFSFRGDRVSPVPCQHNSDIKHSDTSADERQRRHQHRFHQLPAESRTTTCWLDWSMREAQRGLTSRRSGRRKPHIIEGGVSGMVEIQASLKISANARKGANCCYYGDNRKETPMKQLTRTELVIAWLLGIYFGVIAAAIVATSMAVAGITGAWEGMGNHAVPSSRRSAGCAIRSDCSYCYRRRTYSRYGR